MPESRARRRPRKSQPEQQVSKAQQPNAPWFKPVMLTLMIVGLFWIIVFYITGGAWPIPSVGSYNILIGFGIAIAGFLMTTRWRS